MHHVRRAVSVCAYHTGESFKWAFVKVLQVPHDYFGWTMEHVGAWMSGTGVLCHESEVSDVTTSTVMHKRSMWVRTSRISYVHMLGVDVARVIIEMSNECVNVIISLT